jgi:hypothetical protein
MKKIELAGLNIDLKETTTNEILREEGGGTTSK